MSGTLLLKRFQHLLTSIILIFQSLFIPEPYQASFNFTLLGNQIFPLSDPFSFSCLILVSSIYCLNHKIHLYKKELIRDLFWKTNPTEISFHASSPNKNAHQLLFCIPNDYSIHCTYRSAKYELRVS